MLPSYGVGSPRKRNAVLPASPLQRPLLNNAHKIYMYMYVYIYRGVSEIGDPNIVP